MNKVFTLIFIGLNIMSGAQEIVDSTKVWSVLTGHCHPEYTVYTTEMYRFSNDTLMDGKMYKTVFISEDEQQEEWFFFGSFVREENKKVYYREYSGEEGLIYDFNLALGDTVVVNNPRAVSEVTLTLVEIDSVETSEGYHERWKLTNESFEEPEYWIKGIGSMAGILNSTSNLFGGLCGTYILLCEQENNAAVYQNPDYEYCYYDELIVSEEEAKTPNKMFDIRYRQTDKSLDLIFESKEEHHIFITDVKGRLITEKKSSEKQIRVSLAGQPKGLYIIVVHTNDGITVSKKIMVY